MRTWLVILGVTALLLTGATGNAIAEDICFGPGDPAAPIFRLNTSSVAHTSVGDVFTLLGFVASTDELGRTQKSAVTGTIFQEAIDHIRLQLLKGLQLCDAELVANHFPFGDAWTGTCTGTLQAGPIDIVDCVTGTIRIIQ